MGRDIIDDAIDRFRLGVLFSASGTPVFGQRSGTRFGGDLNPFGFEHIQSNNPFVTVKDLPGFSNLVKFNGNKLGVANRNGTLISQLFLFGGTLYARAVSPLDGQAFGPFFRPSREILRQAGQFFLDTFADLVDQVRDNPNENNAIKFAAVNNFLNRQFGRLGLGGLKLDLQTDLAPKYDGFSPDRTAKAALSHLVNLLSDRSRLFIPNSLNLSQNGDLVNFRTTRNFWTNQKIAQIANPRNNPHACGDPSAKMSLPRLISQALNPVNYYAAQGISTNYEDLAERKGVQDNIAARGAIRVARPEGSSEISFMNRALNIHFKRREGNRPMFVSHDFEEHTRNGPDFDSSNLFGRFRTVPKAAETFGLKNNGFLGDFGLYNGNELKQTVAPANIVQNSYEDWLLTTNPSELDLSKIHIKAGVAAPVSCLTCHSDGVRGGRFPLIGRQKDEYVRETNETNEVYKSALEASYARIPRKNDQNRSEPVLAHYFYDFYKDLGEQRILRELAGGENPAIYPEIYRRLHYILRNDPETRRMFKIRGDEIKVTRTDFDTPLKFCTLKGKLGLLNRGGSRGSSPAGTGSGGGEGYHLNGD